MRVGIIGGGLAGLVAALDLAEGGVDVVLLEAGDRFGGQVRTTRERGFLIEEGSDGCHADQPGLLRTLRDLRLDTDLVVPDGLPSLILERGGELKEARPPATALPTTTLREGMASLTHALTRKLERRTDLRLGNAAVAVTRTKPGWTIYPELGASVVTDAVVLALPARPAAWLVHPLTPHAARSLAALATRPLVTVSLGYERDHVRHPLTAAGFVRAQDVTDDGIEVCGFVSSGFRDRAPRDQVLLRVVVRPGRGELVSTTDDGWTEAIHAALRPTLGLTGRPVASWVARWADAIPVHDRRYAATVTDARNALRALGRLELAGAAYDGEGLEGAIVSGRAAARQLLES